MTAPPENHAILLEDGPSLCLREGKAWKLKELDINGSAGHLVASLDRKEGGEGLGGEHKLTIDGSTRIWRGRELLGLDELVAEGSWPAKGQKSSKVRPFSSVSPGIRVTFTNSFTWPIFGSTRQR